jgi:hypothetical protein
MTRLALSFSTLFLFQKIKDRKKKDVFKPGECEDIIARFVISGNGKKIGESVACYDDILIVKNNIQFFGIPLKHIELEGTRIYVKGLIDMDKAIELGEQWRQATYNEIPDKSEDDS